MWPIVTDRVAWSVSLSVTVVGPAKTVELFGMRTRVGWPKEHAIDGGPDPHMGRGNFEGARGGPL